MIDRNTARRLAVATVFVAELSGCMSDICSNSAPGGSVECGLISRPRATSPSTETPTPTQTATSTPNPLVTPTLTPAR